MDTAARPFPATRLIEYVGASSMNNAASMLGKNVTALSKWVASDYHLTDVEADRMAKRIGAMPHEIWDNWWATAVGDSDADDI